jgi:hypothetical protein
VLVAVGVVVLLDRDVHQVSAADRGSLTPEQYVTAVHVARTEIAQQHVDVSRAVATLARRTPNTPTVSPGCTSDTLLVVHLVADFPDIRVGGQQEGAPSGPDMWVTVKADATTGQECLAGVSAGRFTAPTGSADLAPAL